MVIFGDFFRENARLGVGNVAKKKNSKKNFKSDTEL
jgi:hypothetical protein